MGVWLLFGRSAGDALFDAAAAWVLYLALEPHVRRRWAEALVSWSRLLSGRFNDPLVGRDILFAVSAAAVSVALAGLGLEAPRWRGQAPPPFLLDAYLAFLPGAHRFVAWLAGFLAVAATLLSLTCVLLVVLLTAILRGRARAGVALWVVWTAVTAPAVPVLAYGRPSIEQYVLFALLNLVTVLVVARWGLLAFAVYLVTQACLLEGPALLRLPAWHAAPSAWTFLFVLGVLAWGLYASLSARPLRWEGVLEGEG